MSRALRGDVLSLVAVALVIVIIFSTLFFYTGNWPPAVIVESSSMQHGNNFVFGVINTGDIVAVKKANSFEDIQTYLVAREDGGPKTYGDFGNVIVYRNFLLGELVIHRAMFYVEGWNGSSPILYGNDNPPWLTIRGPDVYIYDVGYTHKNLLVDLSQYEGTTGFVTMGDHNFADMGSSGNFTVAADQNTGIDNSLVNQSQVVGYAIGYLPIIGVLKVWGTKDRGYIPETSNEVMVLIIVLVVILVLAPIPSQAVRKKRGKTEI